MILSKIGPTVVVRIVGVMLGFVSQIYVAKALGVDSFWLYPILIVGAYIGVKILNLGQSLIVFSKLIIGTNYAPHDLLYFLIKTTKKRIVVAVACACAAFVLGYENQSFIVFILLIVVSVLNLLKQHRSEIMKGHGNVTLALIPEQFVRPIAVILLATSEVDFILLGDFSALLIFLFGSMSSYAYSVLNFSYFGKRWRAENIKCKNVLSSPLLDDDGKSKPYAKEIFVTLHDLFLSVDVIFVAIFFGDVIASQYALVSRVGNAIFTVYDVSSTHIVRAYYAESHKGIIGVWLKLNGVVLLVFMVFVPPYLNYIISYIGDDFVADYSMYFLVLLPRVIISLMSYMKYIVLAAHKEKDAGYVYVSAFAMFLILAPLLISVGYEYVSIAYLICTIFVIAKLYALVRPNNF